MGGERGYEGLEAGGGEDMGGGAGEVVEAAADIEVHYGGLGGCEGGDEGLGFGAAEEV